MLRVLWQKCFLWRKCCSKAQTSQLGFYFGGKNIDIKWVNLASVPWLVISRYGAFFKAGIADIIHLDVTRVIVVVVVDDVVAALVGEDDGFNILLDLPPHLGRPCPCRPPRSPSPGPPDPPGPQRILPPPCPRRRTWRNGPEDCTIKLYGLRKRRKFTDQFSP